MKPSLLSFGRAAPAVLIATLTAGATAQAQSAVCQAQWQIAARHDQHSDALALRHFGDDAAQKLAPREGRNLAYLDTELRASLSGCTATWSLLARQRATLVTSRGALDLAADIARPGRPAQNEQWDVRGSYLGFAGAGVEWQGAWSPRPGWTLGLGAQALALRHLRERQVDGRASFDAARQAYQFDVHSFEADDRLDFPFQTGFASNGWGLLFAAELAWREGPFGASVSWRDVGWLRWSGLPEQQALLASETQAFDADGFVVYRPLIQGANSQPGRSVRPPLQTRVALDWRPDAVWRLQFRLDGIEGFGTLPALSVSRDFGQLRLGLTWHSHERRAALAIDWQAFSAVFGTDSLGREARSQEFSLRYRWPL